MLEVQLARIRRHGWPGEVLVLDSAGPGESNEELRAIAAAHGARFGLAPRRVSHGLGLDLLAGRVTTPWMVALDSDAWPVQDGWVERLAGHVGKETVLAGPRGTRRHTKDPEKAFAEPYCLLLRMDWYRAGGGRFADQWPRWDTGEQLTIRAREDGKPVDWIPVSSASPWDGDIAAGALYHAWSATRIETVPAEFLARVDGLDVERRKASIESLLKAELAWHHGSGPNPWEDFSSL